MLLITFFLFQALLISCTSPWRADETKNDASPKMNSEFCSPKTSTCFEHLMIYFIMRIHYAWHLLGTSDTFRNSVSKHIVFRPCFRPCCPMIVLLLNLPINFDITSVTKICAPSLILGHILTPEFLFNKRN